MNSITKYITPKDICAQIRMERQRHKGAFFLMEGGTDIKRYRKFIDRSKVELIPCDGKDNVISVLSIMRESGFEDCLGFVDADFNHIDGILDECVDLIYSINHDFDMDVCRTSVIDRYLEEVASEKKLAIEGGCVALLPSLLEGLKPLSAMRYANEKHKLGYCLKNIEIYNFFDGSSIDVSLMIECVSQGKFRTSEYKQELFSYINKYKIMDFDLWQFTNGHDFIAGLGIILQKRAGERTVSQTKKAEVERHVRLSFDYKDFYASGLPQKILRWEETSGYKLTLVS